MAVKEMSEMSIKEGIIFLAKKIINLVNNIEILEGEERERIIKESETMIDNPKKENVAQLKDLIDYLESKTS